MVLWISGPTVYKLHEEPETVVDPNPAVRCCTSGLWHPSEMEEDSSRTISYQDASKSSTEENKKPNPALPSPSRSPSADSLFTSLPAPANALGASRIPSSQDSADSGLGMDISVLQPPQVGGGKPMHFKRGPGRPRKDGAGKSPKTVVSQKAKKLSGLFMPTGGRGIRGRKKIDGAPFVGGTNNITASLGDLNVFNHESPPRFFTTEDTAESDTSSVASSFEKLNDDLTFFPEQWPGKFCALCNLGEKSMLGQGDLIRLEIPSGFDPHSVSKGLSVTSKSEKDSSSDRSPKPSNFFARRQKGVKIKRLTSQGSLECMNEPVDEIVGYAEEPDLNNIFDFSTGFYYVHIQCALWCDDVLRDDDGTFDNLEKEIVRALSQHCSHCGNLGAGITCKAPSCGSCLHFACAATSGGFQQSSSRTTLCASHIDQAVAMLGKGANCTVCDQPGNTSSLLMCCSCNNHYHSACLALNSDPTIRAGWQCPACKVCQACRQPGDDSKLLPCDACDKVYHIFCLRPALTSCPKYSWKCKMCRICTDCGARTPGSGPSSRWHANFTVCDSCYQQRNKGLACPLCGKAYRHVAQKHMVQCHQCKKYVHETCDPAADLNVYHTRKEQNPDYEYTCSVCLASPGGNGPTNPHPRVLLSLKRSSDKDEASSESSSLFNSFTLSQDSFLSPEDDSLPGTESSNDLIWTDKNSVTLVEEIRPPITSVGRGKPLTGNFSKKKLGVGRPRSTDKHGVLNSTNSRRQRMSELHRKRGPKPKIRGVFGVPGVGLQRPPPDITVKCEEEPGVENRLVLCSSRDEFVLQQDVCVMCGAFGSDLEGRLISCAQCGQCYHPFCVNVRVTKVVLQKGWRCLDCTVCEGCGQRHDEARLILCDDCDISFHIYCMDPPLDYVPQGNWKCKWCVVCQSCGSNDPGVNSMWHSNYTLCGPCSSLCTCPVCKRDYTEGELIIRCERCNRWLHSSCDMINNEIEAEKCADDDYQCILCRPSDVLPPHLQPPPVPVVKVITPPRSPEPKSRPLQNFVVDGINLSESGMSYIKSLSLEQPRKKRKKMSNIADMEAGILAAIESVVSGSNCDARPESLEVERSDETNDKDKESNKKKQRNLQKLGIGGFLVRLRGPRFKDDDDGGMENQNSQDGEKPKRKQARKKNKNKIVESFPSYLQEAFFGKTLMDPGKEPEFVSGDELDAPMSPVISDDKYVKLSAEELKAIEQTKARQEQNEKAKANHVPPVLKTETLPTQSDQKVPLKQQIKIEEEEDAEDALQDILPLTSDLLDNDLVNTIMNEGDDMKGSLEDLSGVDSTLGDDTELSLDHNGPDGGHKDELTDFLSSQFNLESGLPSMDSKDVEDIFKGVLTDESQESQDNLFPISTAPPPPPPHGGSAGVQPNSHSAAAQLLSQQQQQQQQQSINPSVVIPTPGAQGSPGLPNRSQLQQSVQQGLASPISFPPPSPYHSEYSNSPQFSPAFSEPPSPWPTPVEAEQETQISGTYNQRSILKWEVDEALGLSATISAVLYANTNHPELKRDFPTWAERSKQIAKIWRVLSPEQRAPYLQKARENRAASRMQKSQQIPKDSTKMVGGGGGGGVVTGGKKVLVVSGSLSQSPDTCDAHMMMKMSPSSSSSCSASGSSCDILTMDSSGSSQLSGSAAAAPTGGVSSFPCTNISAALSSMVPVSVHAPPVSACMMMMSKSSISSSSSNNNNSNSIMSSSSSNNNNNNHHHHNSIISTSSGSIFSTNAHPCPSKTVAAAAAANINTSPLATTSSSSPSSSAYSHHLLPTSNMLSSSASTTITTNTTSSSFCVTSSAAAAATAQARENALNVSISPKMEVVSSRCSLLGDQQIRVLTPSEIMRTLPTLSQESCTFNTLLDQDKVVNGPPIVKPPLRGETTEERHWKQMQVFRQQQQQQQQIVLQEHRLLGEPCKERLGGGSASMSSSPTPKLQYSNAMAQVQRQIGNDGAVGGTDMNRQPLQVTTSHDIGMPAPQSSPHLQSPNSRQAFATSLQGARPRGSAMDMPPPNPSALYSPRPGVVVGNQQSSAPRPPIYSRVPYLHSPRQQQQQQQTASPGDPYATSPMTPQPPGNSDPYAHPPNTPRPAASEGENFPGPNEQAYQKLMGEPYGSGGGGGGAVPNEMDMQEMRGLPSPRPQQQAPQGQETRQHLRDLLQRQQIKKMEQDQMSPGGRNELSSPNTPRPIAWAPDDWQKGGGGSMDGSLNQSFTPRHQLNSPTSPQLHQQSQFRHPFLPPQGRISGKQPQQQPQQQQQQQQQPSIPSQNRAIVPEFRSSIPNAPQSSHALDPSRFRLLLQHQQQQQQQQQRLIAPQQQVANRAQLSFAMGHQQQQQQQQMQQQLQQQQMLQHQVNPQAQFRPGMSVRNPLDPYDHLVAQQQQRPALGLPPDGGGSQSSGSSMLAQQLGRPLNPMVSSQQLPTASSSPPTGAQQQSSSPQVATNRHAVAAAAVGVNVALSAASHAVIPTQADHQELPDSVTAELEKLEQEQQHNDAGGEAETGELADMGIDDDELLGMGADFNILEYADPELDQAVGGEKTNILDNLDLEEEKEEEKDDAKDVKRKDMEKQGKREPVSVASYSSLGGPIQGSPTSVMPKIEGVPVVPPNGVGVGGGGVPVSQSSFLSHPGGLSQSPGSCAGDGQPPILRPPQPPPPPYPVPPPPYPGRPQMGIRNGGGLSMQSMPSMVGMGIGLRSAQMGMVGNVVGLRPTAAHHIPPSPLSSSCNPVMSVQQRRPLLLQEQPLLLEDLLEQEKREQQRQGPGLMGSMPEEPLLSDFDFERLKADVLSSNNLPVSLSPPNVSGPTILPPPGTPGKFSRGVVSQMNPVGSGDWSMESDNNSLVVGNRRSVNPPMEQHGGGIPLHPALAQQQQSGGGGGGGGGLGGPSGNPPGNRVPMFPAPSIPAPPTPPEHPVTEQERQIQARYEEWLQHQHHVLSMQLKYYEPEVYKLRKGKKSLNSKQRCLRKNGGELNEADQMELERITRELSGLQKQLDQSRKQSRQHTLLMQDYQAKQGKRQQMMGTGAPQPQSQPSPLGAAASNSPLHSTPQSPILSPSPSMAAPVSSPLMQHSPMASPLTLSPGPSSLSQTSPRSVGPPLHHLDDRPFSPNNNDGGVRTLTSPQGNPSGMQNRIVVQQQQQQGNAVLRMGSPVGGGQPGLMQQGGNQIMGVGGPGMNQSMMLSRGMNPMHQQRPMVFMDNQRMRLSGPPDQLRMISPSGQRFPRMTQELIMRARGHQNQFQNPNPQVLMSPGGQQYSGAQRVPFPNQSPTGPGSMSMLTSLRSPLPMNSLGLGSPPGNQVIMNQNRVSPASSPMRRPSGSGSVGVASPLPDRPQSVENPLTPRSTGSGPHTPSSMSGSGSGLNCSTLDGMSGGQQQQQHGSDGTHFLTMDNQQDGNGPQGVQNYGMFSTSQGSSQQQQQTDYGGGGGGGGGGAGHSQVIPFPKFSWFDGPVKLGLKGGSPFSVVNGSPSAHSTNIMPEQGQVSLENSISTESITGGVNHTNSAGGDPLSVGSSALLPNSELPLSTSTEASEESEGGSTVMEGQAPSGGAASENVKMDPFPKSLAKVLSKEELIPISSSSSSSSSFSMSGTSAAQQPLAAASVIDLDRIKVEPRILLPDDAEVKASIAVDAMDLNAGETEMSSDMKKVVVLPSSAVPYLLTGMNNVNILPASTGGFQGTATSNSDTVVVSSQTGGTAELPPSSIHQANVGVLGGFRPSKSQAVISQILEQNRLVPIQTIQSMDPSKLQNMQGTPVSLASLVADAVSAATLPFPQVSKSGVPATFINTTVPLITVYTRPEMKLAAGSPHSNLTAVLVASPRLTTSTSNQQQSQGTQQGPAKVSTAGESQNALLKQLLQNTGCASMNQAPTDTTAFSLTSFTKARPSPNIPVHASQLSEAASRIPQPTPPVSKQQSLAPPMTQSPPVRLPFKIEVRVSESPGGRQLTPTSVSAQLPPGSHQMHVLQQQPQNQSQLQSQLQNQQVTNSGPTQQSAQLQLQQTQAQLSQQQQQQQQSQGQVQQTPLQQQSNQQGAGLEQQLQSTVQQQLILQQQQKQQQQVSLQQQHVVLQQQQPQAVLQQQGVLQQQQPPQQQQGVVQQQQQQVQAVLQQQQPPQQQGVMQQQPQGIMQQQQQQPQGVTQQQQQLQGIMQPRQQQTQIILQKQQQQAGLQQQQQVSLQQQQQQGAVQQQQHQGAMEQQQLQQGVVQQQQGVTQQQQQGSLQQLQKQGGLHQQPQQQLQQQGALQPPQLQGSVQQPHQQGLMPQQQQSQQGVQPTQQQQVVLQKLQQQQQQQQGRQSPQQQQVVLQKLQQQGSQPALQQQQGMVQQQQSAGRQGSPQQQQIQSSVHQLPQQGLQQGVQQPQAPLQQQQQFTTQSAQPQQPPLAAPSIVQQQSIPVKVTIKLEDRKSSMNDDSVELPKESSSSSSIKDVIDIVAMDKNSSETTVTESKRTDEDVKKTKRRQYQPKKRPSIVKESSTPKKRLRKGSKLEEDYDAYMDTMMAQIRGLPPVNIMEPELGQNYNVCPIYGAGDYSKINTKGYSIVQGELIGTFGNATVSSQDYYNEQPFGPEPPSQSPKSPPSYRGFYHQEFGAPKVGTFGPKHHSDDRSPTPFRETDTPDTIVSSSSPECVLDNTNMYPGLKLIDEDEEERLMHMRDSPVIPLFAPIPIRPIQAENLPKNPADEVDKENISTIPETFVFKAKQGSGGSSPLKENGNLTVTLTLSSHAAEDISGVLRNLANVLSITAPQIYQVVERTITPPSQKLGLYTYKGKDGKEIVDIQSILNGTAKFCRHCDVVVLNNVIRKKVRDLPGIVPEDSLDESDELYFCSTPCFMQYAMTHGVTLPSEDKAGAVVKHPSEGGEGGIVKAEKSKLPLKDSRLSGYDHEIIKFKDKSSSAARSSSANNREMTTGEGEKNLKRALPSDVRVKEEEEPTPPPPPPPGKKWKGIKYKKWLPSHAHAQVKYKRPTEKEMTEMLFRMKITVTPSRLPDDTRRCMFCHQVGDRVSDGPGRLLNYDVDKWVHLNCALWSEEVYETESGALMNVELALKQSFVLLCIACKQKGATVKCFKTRCSSVYHLGCAVKEGCVFYKNKTVFCSAHMPKGEKENELTTLSVFRRVYIHRDENRQVAAVMHHADQHNLLRVGSLIFLNVGQLLPHQLQNFHTSNFIYPVGYKIVRFYWSMKRANKRCQYICSIHDVDGKPEFRIAPQEEGSQEAIFKASSAQGAWHQVLDSIAKLRNASNTIKVFPKYITGEDLFGLTEPAIVRVLESLPGIETLTDYHFKYGRNPLLELPLAINPTGCARSEPKLRTHFKRPHTQRTGSSSRSATSITSSVLSSSEAVCPYSKQFVHSKSSQYKKMKQDWRNNVYLARSKIQGLGLYAARDIEKHTMVIEYIGEIIRTELAELREKKYEAQNRGIYMFRVDEDRVIDATLCGGLARYINHSCNPNCVAETVEVDRDWRIIIFANRRISRGEELAYDYKFEFEDDQHKIQCFCGAPNCRQWMN